MTREEMNQSVLKNKKSILEQKMVLEKLLSNDMENLESTNTSIEHYNSNVKAYNDYKKRTLSQLLLNVVQVTGIFGLIALSSKFIFSTDVLSTFNIGMGICALYGDALLLFERNFNVKDYKKTLFEGIDIEDLNDSKNYLEDHIDTLKKDLSKVNDSLSKFKIEEPVEKQQDTKDYKSIRRNIYTNYGQEMTNKVKKLHK